MPTQIRDVKALPNGCPVETTTFTIASVYPRELKDGQHGKYTTQNIYVTDSDGADKILVQLGNQPEVKKEDQGKEIVVSHNQLKGCQIAEYTNRDGAVVKYIKINKAGMVQIGVTASPVITPPSKPSKPTVNNTPANVTNDEKNRAVGLSYAKDLVCNGKVELKDMFLMADKVTNYITTGVKPEIETTETEEIPF